MAAWTDANRLIKGKLEVNWNKDGASWTDESANMLAAAGNQSMLNLWQMAGGSQAQPPWTANFQLRNNADRYSPLNSSSPIYSNIRYNKMHGIPIRFSMGIDDGLGGFTYTRVFTGYIDSLSVDSTRTDRASIVCMDNAHPLLQRKVTTTMYLKQYADDWIGVLASEGGVASTSLDEGMFEIPFCWCDDENSWTEMNKVASADGGWLFFDKDGTLTFENAEAWAADTRHNTSQATLGVTRVGDFALPFDWSDVYNEVIVEYAPRVQRGKAILYELDEVVTVLPGDTDTIMCYLRYPATSIDTPVLDRDYFVSSATGSDLSDDLTVSLTKYAQRVEAEFTSSQGYHLIYIDSFRLLGRMLQGYQALQEKMQATDSDIGDPTSDAAKTLRVSGNEYIQTPHQARFLVEMLRDRVKTARQLYQARNVPAIPTLQPGDRVTCTESGSGLNNQGFIQTIAWRYGGGSYRADYEIIDATDWYINDDYFELGTDVLAATSDKVFY